MKYKIAVPNNEFYKPLYENLEIAKKYNYEIYPVPEDQLNELMLSNRVDAALISPYGYGLGVIHADYRIAKGPSLSAAGYNALASIFFNPGENSFKRFAATAPTDFLQRIGRLLFLELYSIKPELSKKIASPDELLKEFDAAIVYGESKVDDSAMDICEEWYMSSEQPLPLAFWIVRNEEDPEGFEDFIKEVANQELPKEERIRDKTDTVGERQGHLIWQWTEDISFALEHVLEFLFMHHEFEEMPAVKFIGEKSVLGEDFEKTMEEAEKEEDDDE